MFAVRGTDVPQGRLYFFTKQGVVKLTPWSEYAVAKSSFVAMKLKDGDAVLDVQQEIPDADFMFVTQTGMGLNCSDTFSEYKRMSGGIQGMDLYDDDEVVQVTQIDKDKDYDLVVATGLGTFKRVYLSTVNRLLLGEPVLKGEKIYLLIEDTDGNTLYADSSQFAIESRTTKGKPVAALGIFAAKGVCSFRLNDKK